MAQNVNLSIAGLYTSMSDFNGLPPGALEQALNIESPYKNIAISRNGFARVPNTSDNSIYILRLTNFNYGGTNYQFAIRSDGKCYYYDPAHSPSPAWVQVPNFSDNISPPDTVLAKSRFIKAAQNLYLTSSDGVRSLAPSTGADMIRAGVPKGLNIEAVTNGDLSGFLEANDVSFLLPGNTISVDSVLALEIFPNIFSFYIYSSGTLLPIASIPSEITVGLFIGGYTPASLSLGDLSFRANIFGASGNSINIAYVNSGGAISVSVVGSAITVNFNSGVSTALAIAQVIASDPTASALVSVDVAPANYANAQTAPQGPTNLSGGLDSAFSDNTTVTQIIPSVVVANFTGDTTVGFASIGNASSAPPLGSLITGSGIPDNSVVISITGGGPYTIGFTNPSGQGCTVSGTGITFNVINPPSVTISQAPISASAQAFFYTGSQVGYRIVYGRVEDGTNGTTTTKLGSPTSFVTVTNTSFHSTNVTVTATLPKNASDEISFYQAYRTFQTTDASITPSDQEKLVWEATITPTDFTNRIISFTDTVPEALLGIPLYTGSDQEGLGQANDPPPQAWDMCTFRDFALYANIRQPAFVDVTIVGVGSPNGIQVGDTITISGTYLGSPFSEVYTASNTEVPVSRQFQVVTTGTPAQNIADTTASLIRVVNYDEACPVHLILLSTSVDLPGEILFEADNPGVSAFSLNASAHANAYDPPLSNLAASFIQQQNMIALSKAGELDAVPALNTEAVGNSSTKILRMIPLRDYVFIVKEDGIYKGTGYTPDQFTISPFDYTTKIIGPDTAVALNGTMMMFSNQGVVSVDDSGVEAKSVPVDDQLNAYVAANKTDVIENSFAIGYETKRKYILAIPTTNSGIPDLEYVYNYITSTWTNWGRALSCGFIDSDEDLLYIGRQDSSGADKFGMSQERNTFTYTDYVDESYDRNVVSKISNYVIQLDDVSQIVPGDLLVQSTYTSMILSVDLVHTTVTVFNNYPYTAAACEIFPAIDCQITWKGIFADNPAFVRQYNEGIVLFKRLNFANANMDFQTDFVPDIYTQPIFGYQDGSWGNFPWGLLPWGGESFPRLVRFAVPTNSQMGSYLKPTLRIRQGYSNFIIQGLSMSYNNVSQEVGWQR